VRATHLPCFRLQRFQSLFQLRPFSLPFATRPKGRSRRAPSHLALAGSPPSFSLFLLPRIVTGPASRLSPLPTRNQVPYPARSFLRWRSVGLPPSPAHVASYPSRVLPRASPHAGPAPRHPLLSQAVPGLWTIFTSTSISLDAQERCPGYPRRDGNTRERKCCSVEAGGGQWPKNACVLCL
jgi:hypothetical protein